MGREEGANWAGFVPLFFPLMGADLFQNAPTGPSPLKSAPNPSIRTQHPRMCQPSSHPLQELS